MIDKNKLKEKIQKTPSKDLLYMTVNPVDSMSNKNFLKKIERDVKGEMLWILICKK